MQGNAMVAQGGGPTAVINQSLAGVILEARKHPQIQNLYGAIRGVRGILNEDFMNLSLLTDSHVLQVAQSPSAALLSTRDKPDEEYCKKLLEIFQKHNIRYFYYIGGNDSSDTVRIVSDFARKQGYLLSAIHIPKTVDNDLVGHDHTPGFPSAAKFVAQAFSGLSADTRALGGVFMGVVMGRHAGFLTASSALARRYPDDGPHLILPPEVPFDEEKFLKKVEEIHQKLGYCVVAVSEGILNKEGVLVSESIQGGIAEVDAHGNKQLSGGSLADALTHLIKTKTKIKRVRADTFGFVQRCYAGSISSVDAQEAFDVGQYAVLKSVKGEASGSVAMIRKGDYVMHCELIALEKVAGKTRHMEPELLNPEEYDITPQFLNYLRPLVGPLDLCQRLF